MEPYVIDVISDAGDKIKKMKLGRTVSNIPEINIICDGHALAYYFAAVSESLREADSRLSVNLIFAAGGRNPEFEACLDGYFSKNENIRLFDSYDAYFRYYSERIAADTEYKTELEQHSSKFIVMTDLRKECYRDQAEQERWLNGLEQILQHASRNKINCVFPVTILPYIEALPEGIEGVSEREWEVLYADRAEYSVEKYVIRIEDVCRKYCDSVSLKGIRLDHVIGPGIPDTPELPIRQWVNEMVQARQISVPPNAKNIYYSASYVTDVLVAAWGVLLKGRPGNLYHVSSMNFNLLEICYELYSAFSKMEIKLDIPAQTEAEEYHLLNAKKLLLVAAPIRKYANYTLREAVFFVALHTMKDYENYKLKEFDVYYGKMNRIRKLELELILRIDEICRKHQIKYFLTAGSMLGAVRHGGFIPWDDDMDIGMLPEDYKRFLEVAPEELAPEYAYQTTDLEPESLYIHDKIRIKNTCFSTRYSNQFFMQNGVYIDIFVYYKTSDNPKKQNRHIRQIAIMRRLLGLRWINRPRRHVHYYKSLLVLPIMRCFGTPFFRHLYVKLLSRYEKKNTHYMIDGTGFNLEKVGAFPAEWFEGEVVYKNFEGHSLPVLARYDDFLRHWYGEHYMELLPISKRKSVHDVIRIDLGEYLTDGVDKRKLHEIDLRGEFFEKKRSNM